MKLITINILDGKGYITVAVQDNAFDADRLEAFLNDATELFIKKEYIEQEYAKVILSEQPNAIITVLDNTMGSGTTGVA